MLAHTGFKLLSDVLDAAPVPHDHERALRLYTLLSGLTAVLVAAVGL